MSAENNVLAKKDKEKLWRLDRAKILFQEVMKLQMRYAYHEGDKKKNESKTDESVADHLFTCSYLLDYIFPILQEERIEVDYQKTFDILLASNLADIDSKHEVIVNKTFPQKINESLTVVRTTQKLPRRENFHAALWQAYVEYEVGETIESRLAKAIKGAANIIYIFSKDKLLRKKLVRGNGFTERDWMEKIETYTKEFPVLKELFEVVFRRFRIDKMFREEPIRQTQSEDLFSETTHKR